MSGSQITVVVQPQVTRVLQVNQGLPGSLIYTGTATPSNLLGSNGDLYINSATNDWYQKSLGAWVLKGNFGGGGGGGTGAYIDINSRGSPQVVALTGGTLVVGSNQRTRSFLVGNAGQAVDPAIPDGFGSQELMLFVTSDSRGLALHNASNLTLYGGEFIGINGSILVLIWDAQSKWTEVGRNNVLI